MAIEFTQEQLDEIYAFAIDLGRKAGELLLQSIEKRIAGEGQNAYAYAEKDNAVDIVTRTDEGTHILSLTSSKESN